MQEIWENCAIIYAETAGQKPPETGRFGRKRAARPAVSSCDIARFVLQNEAFGKAICAVSCFQTAHTAKQNDVFVKIFRATALPVPYFIVSRSVNFQVSGDRGRECGQWLSTKLKKPEGAVATSRSAEEPEGISLALGAVKTAPCEEMK